MLGHCAISETPISALPGTVTFTTFMAEGADLHRVADDDLDQYELYHSEDTGEPDDPDLDGTPFATFASLPYTTPTLTYPAIHKFILCKRNRWGLLSRNRTVWRLELDDAGQIVQVKPSAPVEVTLEAAAGGTFKVTAKYLYLPDGAYAADKWLVYLTTGGGDPDPDVDTPTVGSLVKVAGVATLSWTSGAFAHGAAGKVLVRTRRTDTPDADSANTTATGPVSASTAGPAAPAGGAFFGAVAEQKQ